jgi:hypothetical protein
VGVLRCAQTSQPIAKAASFGSSSRQTSIRIHANANANAKTLASSHLLRRLHPLHGPWIANSPEAHRSANMAPAQAQPPADLDLARCFKGEQQLVYARTAALYHMFTC